MNKLNLYETPALFKQNMSPGKQDRFRSFYQELFGQYEIKTIHDCSIGAGGTTLPLALLGYQISGSDLSESLLNQARNNFSEAGYDVKLFPADFRDLDKVLTDTYDAVISTGNSLPHINNQDVHRFIKSISTKINPNGFLYLDMRNWDKLLQKKPIFSARDPLVMTAEEHTSLYQIWNWHDDQSVDFVFVTSTDKDGKHEKSSILFAPTYYPLKYKNYEKMLNENGFEIRACFDVDYLWLNSQKEEKTGVFADDFAIIDWYAVLAQKVC